MNSLHKLAVATLIVAAPSLSFAQGKAPHPTPPVVMGKSAPVRQDNRTDKIADKAERKADRTADQSARLTDKIERSELNFAHDQKLMTKGIRLTSAEKNQLKAIEKKYDADYRDLLQKAKADDRAAKKNGTVSGSHQGLKVLPHPLSDAAFQSQLSQLQTQERTDMRAVLTPQQQSIFDTNVSKLSTPANK
jgi:Spy/CpxP family protein refolding chaperone